MIFLIILSILPVTPSPPTRLSLVLERVTRSPAETERAARITFDKQTSQTLYKISENRIISQPHWMT